MELVPYYQDVKPDIAIYHGDCRVVLAQLPESSVDSVVTDPPYELGFMGKGWDRSGIAYNLDVWRECLRVLKPGGHLLAFGGSRTYHRLACAIEDAGFEIRDQIQYIYGSGFPKSLNVSKNLREQGSVCICDETRPQIETTNDATVRGVRARVDTKDAGATSSQQDVLADVREHADRQGQHRTKEAVSHGEVPALRVGISSTEQETKSGLLQPFVQGEGSREPLVALCGEHERAQTERSKVRSGQPRMEGRGDGVQKEGQLYGSALCASAGVGEANGPQGRLHHGAPTSDGTNVRISSHQNGSGKSQEPQTIDQRREQSGIVPDERGSQTRGSWPLCSWCFKPMVPEGIGSALKPAHEPIVVARKPFTSTLIQNVLQHGTGGLNIDECRIETVDRVQSSASKGVPFGAGGYEVGEGRRYGDQLGRWPANVIHDGSEEVLAGFPDVAPSVARTVRSQASDSIGTFKTKYRETRVPVTDSGSAARFFYCAKASKEDREEGLESLPIRSAGEVTDRQDGSDGLNSPRAGAGRTNGSRNHHPTVKPTDLMCYLCRLITPPDGTVLDPFLGSGSTGKAARREGFKFIGIELNEEYCQLAANRCEILQRGMFD